MVLLRPVQQLRAGSFHLRRHHQGDFVSVRAQDAQIDAAKRADECEDAGVAQEVREQSAEAQRGDGEKACIRGGKGRA